MEQSYFVYIIYSSNYDTYYRGYSTNPTQRLSQHNNKESKYTRNFCPWELVYVEELPSKTEALQREKGLKKYSKVQIRELMEHPKNIVRKFI